MSKKIIIPIPKNDFDPTETAVPWKILKNAGHKVVFATPDMKPAQCDQRMLHGTGLGPLKAIFAADQNARMAYLEMSQSDEFIRPIAWGQIKPTEFDGILLPGGHAKEMREYLESKVLQACIADFFHQQKPVGAICHGVVLAGRSQITLGKSVLFGRKTTALLASQEMVAWGLTCLWLGNYYRTYSQTVENEVKSMLASPKDFLKGPLPLKRDSAGSLADGFVVRDDNYLSARWPGDAHLFGEEFLKLLETRGLDPSRSP